MCYSRTALAKGSQMEVGQLSLPLSLQLGSRCSSRTEPATRNGGNEIWGHSELSMADDAHLELVFATFAQKERIREGRFA